MAKEFPGEKVNEAALGFMVEMRKKYKINNIIILWDSSIGKRCGACTEGSMLTNYGLLRREMLRIEDLIRPKTKEDKEKSNETA